MKKPKRLSTTHWCPAALDFLDATVRFLQQGPRALIPQHVLRDERPASIASPCATKHPAFKATAWHAACMLPASKYSPPECVLLPSGRLGPSHPDQTSSACSKIFPSTQTEQNPGHFKHSSSRIASSEYITCESSVNNFLKTNSLKIC